MSKKIMPKGREFQKGVSGNPNGRPKGRISFIPAIEEALREEIRDPNGNPIEIRKALIKTLIKEGLQGNVRALEYIIDKIDGKATQRLEIEQVFEVTKEELQKVAKAITDESK